MLIMRVEVFYGGLNVNWTTLVLLKLSDLFLGLDLHSEKVAPHVTVNVRWNDVSFFLL